MLIYKSEARNSLLLQATADFRLLSPLIVHWVLSFWISIDVAWYVTKKNIMILIAFWHLHKYFTLLNICSQQMFKHSSLND